MLPSSHLEPELRTCERRFHVKHAAQQRARPATIYPTIYASSLFDAGRREEIGARSGSATSVCGLDKAVIPSLGPNCGPKSVVAAVNVRAESHPKASGAIKEGSKTARCGWRAGLMSGHRARGDPAKRSRGEVSRETFLARRRADPRVGRARQAGPTRGRGDRSRMAVVRRGGRPGEHPVAINLS